jgi:hypothetical protein
MKLLLCGACFDLRRVHREGTTTCDCGASSAFHTDDLHVEIRGPHAHKVFLDNRDVANFTQVAPPEGPHRLYATFDWRTTPGYKGGTWLRAEEKDR